MNRQAVVMRIAKIVLVLFCWLFLLIAFLQSISAEGSPYKENLAGIPTSPTPVSIEAPPDLDGLPLQDNPNVYQYDDPGSVVTMYVTVRRGNASDNSNYSWGEVDSYSRWVYEGVTTVTVGKADAILQIGDENGPLPGELGYGLDVPNATIQIRGASSLRRKQKSYKIELFRDAGNWRGQSTIALNKHVFDPSRVRNKLNFDLMKEIPDLVSLRTQFVHLYIKDETLPRETEFEDYGLFTQVELPNKQFLENHLLDPHGQLYKARFFEFRRYPEQIRLIEDSMFSEDNFSSIVEIKGNSDNSKLIQMLDDLNDLNIPINETFEKYFNADNYFTWLAYNILVGNIDTQSQNFYLYSPQSSNKFYFMPWDYDGAFPFQSQVNLKLHDYAPWQIGVSNYWGSVLPNRLLREPAYRQKLDVKVQELMEFLTPERISSLLAMYKPVVEKYAFVLPDSNNIPTDEEGFEQDLLNLPTEVQNNYYLYLESLKSPMPFFLGVPKIINGRLNFIWDPSYDFRAENITYHFVLARDPALKDILFEKTLVNGMEIQIYPLSPGEYYWGVVATNSSGKYQVAFDTFVDHDGNKHFGIKHFIVASNGDIVE